MLDGSGLSLDIRRELVLFLVNDTIVEPILSTIKEAGRISEPGAGIKMLLSVVQTAGLENQISKTKH